MNSPKDVTYVKLLLIPEKAAPSAQIGSAVGSKGVNPGAFCKEFNEKSKGMGHLHVPVVVAIKKDKTFSISIKKPSVSLLIKDKIKLASGSKKPGKEIVAKISKSDVKSIAEYKISDMQVMSLDGAIEMVAGTARSMGIEVVD